VRYNAIIGVALGSIIAAIISAQAAVYATRSAQLQPIDAPALIVIESLGAVAVIPACIPDIALPIPGIRIPGNVSIVIQANPAMARTT
jgi:hypothetical protein